MGTSGASIVVIDDVALVRAVFEIALTRAGCAVTSAASAEEGLAACVRLRPAVVIVDIFMPPERSGLDVIRALGRWSSPPKIIAITGGGAHEDYDVLARAKDIGADVTLRKPVASEVLVDAVEALLIER